MSVVSDKTTIIDGKTYTTKTLPASEGLRLMPKIITLFGEKILALFVSTDEKQAEGLLKNPKVVAAMLVEMAEKAGESEDGWLVMKDLMKYTTCDKVQVGAVEGEGSVFKHFDDHFAGDYQHLLQVAMWVTHAGFTKP